MVKERKHEQKKFALVFLSPPNIFIPTMTSEIPKFYKNNINPSAVNIQPPISTRTRSNRGVNVQTPKPTNKFQTAVLMYKPQICIKLWS